MIKKGKVIKYFIYFGFGVIFLYTFYLQLIRGGKLFDISQNNYLQIFKIPAPRGEVYDRNGKVLITNQPGFSVFFSNLGLSKQETESNILKLSSYLNIPYEELLFRLEQNPQKTYIVRVAEKVPADKIFRLSEEKMNLKYVDITVEPIRFYPQGRFASHILGYLGEINKQELESFSPEYRVGDLVGKTGVENIYEKYLRGEDGGWQVEIDAYGNYYRKSNFISPQPGNDLTLTIDYNIQSAAEESLEGKSGVIIVLNPANGEILALVSHPNFDPNLFSTHLERKECERILNDPSLPLFNRALQGLYSPGSLFKVIPALAALENEVITPQTKIYCKGETKIGKDQKVYKCWKKEGHGAVNIISALSESCDIYFYKIGIDVGVKKIINLSKDCGLGRKTKIDLFSEKDGFLPSPEWKKDKYNTIWFPGDTANLSIGQGYVLATPIQIANLFALIANRGENFRPFIVKEVKDKNQNVIEEFYPQKLHTVKLNPQTFDIVIKGLKEVVKSGTAKNLKFDKVDVAGKTGTAQNPQGQDHAWFTCFAPVENPQVLILVLVEHGGSGSVSALPIAQKLLGVIFNDES